MKTLVMHLRRPITLIGMFGVAALVIVVGGGSGGRGMAAEAAGEDVRVAAAAAMPETAPLPDGEPAAVELGADAPEAQLQHLEAVVHAVAAPSTPVPVVALPEASTTANALGTVTQTPLPVPATVTATPTPAPTSTPVPPPTPRPRPRVYQVEVYGQWRLYIEEAPGAQPRLLSTGDWDDGEPSLSPDGTRIAFVSNRSGRFHVYVMNIDGSGVRQLTYGDFDDRAPAWSADGTIIAFTSDRDGNPAQVFLVLATGGEARPMVRPSGG